MSKWVNISIRELGKTITGKTPSSACLDDFGNVYMFVTPSDNLDCKFINTTTRFLSKKGYEKLKKKSLPPLSILVSCIGSAMGKVTMNYSTCITNQQINSIIPYSIFSANYIYYNLKNNYILLRNSASGSTALPLLNKTDFDNLIIRIHKDKTEQQRIASILSSLDDKIELNNKINDNLEKQAKLLYDYWFVQFEFPNEDGKPYKSSGGKMVYNKQLKREIPEGWEVKELCQIANITMGQSPAGSSYNNDKSGTVFFQGSTDFGPRYPTVRQYTTEPCRMAKAGDILLSVRAPVGSINIASENCCIGRGLAALRSKDEVITFLYGVVKKYESVFNLRNTSGTTFGSITKDDLYSLPVIYPVNDILRKYEITIQPYFIKQTNLNSQNQQLSSLRDWLLPMLMNGQVKVE